MFEGSPPNSVKLLNIKTTNQAKAWRKSVTEASLSECVHSTYPCPPSPSMHSLWIMLSLSLSISALAVFSKGLLTAFHPHTLHPWKRLAPPPPTSPLHPSDCPQNRQSSQPRQLSALILHRPATGIVTVAAEESIETFSLWRGSGRRTAWCLHAPSHFWTWPCAFCTL